MLPDRLKKFVASSRNGSRAGVDVGAMRTLLDPGHDVAARDDERPTLFTPPPPMPVPTARGAVDLDVAFMLLVLATIVVEAAGARLAEPSRAIAVLAVDAVLLGGIVRGRAWARTWMLARGWLGALVAPVLALFLARIAPELALGALVTAALCAGWIWYLTRAEVRERFVRTR